MSIAQLAALGLRRRRTMRAHLCLGFHICFRGRSSVVETYIFNRNSPAVFRGRE